jgi:hypothetical protein
LYDEVKQHFYLKVVFGSEPTNNQIGGGESISSNTTSNKGLNLVVGG